MGQKERFYVDIMAAHPEVTGSCNLLIAKFPNGESVKFVVDCGLFQERIYSEYNRSLPFIADDIDFVLLTHNHIDHSGRLPFLYSAGYRGPIYTSISTTILLPLGLGDSYRVLKDTAKRQNEKCLYSESDVDGAIQLVRGVRYEEEVQVHPRVTATFFKNGHLMGAGLILVRISFPDYNDINLLFTGDYNDKNMFFDVPKLPKEVTELPLTIIQESTYGTMNSSEIKPCFEENVLRCVAHSGTVVATMFSLGRGQEIPYIIKCMQERDLDPNIPIYYDGKLAIRYTGLHLKGGLDIKPEMKDFLPQNLTYVDKTTRRSVIESPGPKIILTTSGMGSYGPAQTYIPEFISNRNAMIHFTGYCAEDTMGYNLKHAQAGTDVEVGGLVVRKRAEVEFTNEYSAHAKADEMIKFLEQFKNLKLILVNHGNTDVKKKFAARVLDEVETKYVGILSREYFYRVCPFGLVKTMSTKFK